MRLIFVLIAVLGFQIASAAEATHALMTQEEQNIHNRAKKRLYPGGKDEESLKVQAQLPQTSRKMGPATEAPADESEADQATD